jgi:hypothetical protein
MIDQLTEKDFQGAPITEESDGIYKFITVNGIMYFLNVETGEITE